MHTPRETTQMSQRQNPASTLRTLIDWIIETDRRFRMTQDQIDRVADRF